MAFPPLALAEALVNRAALRERSGDHTGALSDVQQVIGTDATLADAWRMRGFIKMGSRDYPGAVESYRKVVALDTPAAEDWVSLGLGLEQVGKAKPAQEALEKALDLAPDNDHALQSIAAFHGRQGNVQRSLDYIERALAIDSSPQGPGAGPGSAGAPSRSTTGIGCPDLVLSLGRPG